MPKGRARVTWPPHEGCRASSKQNDGCDTTRRAYRVFRSRRRGSHTISYNYIATHFFIYNNIMYRLRTIMIRLCHVLFFAILIPYILHKTLYDTTNQYYYLFSRFFSLISRIFLSDFDWPPMIIVAEVSILAARGFSETLVSPASRNIEPARSGRAERWLNLSVY